MGVKFDSDIQEHYLVAMKKMTNVGLRLNFKRSSNF